MASDIRLASPSCWALLLLCVQFAGAFYIPGMPTLPSQSASGKLTTSRLVHQVVR